MCLRLVPAALALVLLTASGASAQTAEVIEQLDRQLTLKRLEGVWVPDLLVTTRGAEPYPFGVRSLALLDGGVFVRTEGKGAVASGAFKVEDGFLRLAVEERPVTDLESPSPRPKLRYAFRVEGDVLTLAYSAGAGGKAGDLTPGEGRQVVVYKRQPPVGPVTESRRQR